MGCGGATETMHPADQSAPSSQEAPRAAKDEKKTKTPKTELAELIRKFAKELRISGVSGADTLDIWGLIEDFDEAAVFLLTEINVNRLDAFVAELSKDDASLENIVAVKNLFLDPACEGTCMYPEGQAVFLEKLANNPKAIETILKIRDGLYGPDGQRLKSILLQAAKDPVKRKTFLSGQAFDSGGNWSSWQLCSLFTLDLYWFSRTDLRKHLKEFSTISGEDSELDNKELTWAALKLISIVDYESLDFFHALVKSLTAKQLKDYLERFAKQVRKSRHEEQISKLVPELFKFYTGKSLKNLDKKEFGELLEQLASYKKDALLFVQEATYHE